MLGQDIDLAALAGIVDLDGASVLEHLEPAIRAGILTDGADRHGALPVLPRSRQRDHLRRPGRGPAGQVAPAGGRDPRSPSRRRRRTPSHSRGRSLVPRGAGGAARQGRRLRAPGGSLGRGPRRPPAGRGSARGRPRAAGRRTRWSLPGRTRARGAGAAERPADHHQRVLGAWGRAGVRPHERVVPRHRRTRAAHPGAVAPRALLPGEHRLRYGPSPRASSSWTTATPTTIPAPCSSGTWRWAPS